MGARIGWSSSSNVMSHTICLPPNKRHYIVGITLLEKAKLAREISDGKNEILHKFLSHKI